MTTSTVPFPLQEIVSGAIAKAGLNDWQMHEDDFWCHVTGPTQTSQIQGWKLHVSATPLSAPLVLHAAAQVLLTNGCQFKFAKDLDSVRLSTSVAYHRAQAGKFVTAYPSNEEEFHRLAIQLCDATLGMPGPRILSDRPYRPNSIVQYRFGAFRGVSVLTNDGTFEGRIQSPAGDLVTDQRNPWFSPPEWVDPIMPRGSASAPDKSNTGNGSSARPMLADGRFEVVRALRHSARGGVYRATDTKSGYPVLIKAARAHIGSDRRGWDSRALLAYESKVLTELSPLTPDLVSLFDTEDHTFLAEQFIEGRTITRDIADSVRQPDVRRQRELAFALVKLVDAVHRRGWVLRDLNSNNIMVTPERHLILIDVEHAVRQGDVVSRIYTPGFVAPETLDSPAYGYAPDRAVDVFGIGAILIHFILGYPPAFMAHQGGAGPTIAERIHRLLALAQAERPLICQWWPLLTGLCESDPGRRWTLAQAADFLQSEQRAHVSPVAPMTLPISSTAPLQGEQGMQDIVDDGVKYLLSTMTPDADRLWKADAFGQTTDPSNIQYGAAGVLAVLARAAGHGNPNATEALPLVVAWTRKQLNRTPRVLPGLYFGRAGTVWALRESAELLGDTDLAAEVEEFAMRLPTRWPNPDICHGAAGAGLTLLRLWQLSKCREFLDRARDCADGLLAATRHTEDGVFWPVPADFDSTLAGIWHFGFAHGVAGVGAFLLAAAQACGDPRYLDMANAAGQTLAAAVDLDQGTGAATWRTDRDRHADGGMLFHWCSGASGVGSFLLRLAAVQPDEASAKPYRELVHGAAVAVHAARWISPTAACHGLAGNGQFLLDAAEQASAEAGVYRGWAEDLAQVIAARVALHNGLKVIPDESGFQVMAGYGTGLAGVLDFLLRLRHGGKRAWMVELP